MEMFRQGELQKAEKVVSSSMANCKKMQPKFKEGTPQYSLLKNRIQALQIVAYLITDDQKMQMYSDEALQQALPPIVSIIHKTKKAQSKCETGSAQYKRFVALIEAMGIAKSLLEEEIVKRNKYIDFIDR